MGGPAWTMVKKALRVRRKMFALARAKENAIREMAGYPPLTSWWESCYSGCMASIRVVICRGFCPCCVGRLSFKSICCPRTTCCGRCFYEGDYENEVLKNILGFVGGSALTLLFYAWLCIQKDYPKFQAAIISCVFGVVLTLGMAFAHTVRCLVFLTVPSMFSKKGRRFLLMYATVLVFSYPAANISTNLQVMADSATCGQSLMMNETRKLIAMASEPLSAMVDTLQDMYENIKAFAMSLMSAFKALLRAVKEIISAVAAVFKWLYNLVDICNEKMGEPYRKCKKAFDDAYDDCRDRLGIFGFLCEIVSAASHLCHLARIGELLCAISAAIKGLVVDAIKKATVGSISDLREMFWFEIEIDRRYDYSMNQSRSYTEVKDAIMAEVKAKVSGYSGVLSVLDNVMMISVFYVFTKAWRYRRGYLTKDGYDNYYITPQMYAIDERRKELGRDTLFPLKKIEESKYLTLFSPKLTRKETRKLLKGVALWFLGAYNAAFYMLTDYGLYWILDMVSRHLDVKTTAAVPPFMQLHVNGKGPLADMYRTMVGLLDPLADSGLDIDTSVCLPIPNPPDFNAYRTIITLYILCLILSAFEAYGLRMRRAIAACYYPQRERQRAVWLYNQILFKRGSFFKFARRQIRRKYKDDKEIQKMSIRGRIIRQFPRLKRLVKMCGYDFKNCILCGKEGKPQDMDNFSHCGNYGCTAIYCNECFEDLNNMCTLCMNPVDYGDLSDASEEIDSSEDEELVAFKKRKAKEKRARIEAKRRQQQPKNVMDRFKGLFLTPPSRDPQADGAQSPLLGTGRKMASRGRPFSTSTGMSSRGMSPGVTSSRGASSSRATTRGMSSGVASSRHGSPGFSRGRSPGFSRGRSPGFMRGRSPGFSRGRSPGFMRGRSPGFSRGRSPGFMRGRSPGFSRGRSPGFSRGRSPGFSRGRSPRFSRGRSPGFSRGASSGFSHGRSPSAESSNGEPSGQSGTDAEQSAEDSSSSADSEQYDTSYQHARKSDIATSTANDSSSDSDSRTAGNKNLNMNWPGKRTPLYETLDIFNVDSPDELIIDGDTCSSFNRSFTSDTTSDGTRDI